MMGWINRAIQLLALVIAIAGCSSLPRYAQPKFSTVELDEVDMSDVITYRKLERADFKGSEPPKGFDERMAAVTCVYTRPVIDPAAIVMNPDANGKVINVRIDRLHYQALMDRNCSWWNPDATGLTEDYILQHEQIHFALFEAAARRWSEPGEARFQIKAGSEEAMIDSLQDQFRSQFEEKMRRLAERNRQFDEETSMGFNPQKQKQWWKMVLDEMGGSAFPETP